MQQRLGLNSAEPPERLCRPDGERDPRGPSLSEYARTCLAGGPPPCAVSCPLGLDVLGLIGKLKSGLYPAAAKLFRSQAVFPGIVGHVCREPCRPVCVRSEAGDAVRLNDIEKWLWALMRQKKNPAYHIPPQHKKY